jgi:hypothetical protein
MTLTDLFHRFKFVCTLSLLTVLVSCRTQQNIIAFKVNGVSKTYKGNGVSNHDNYGTRGNGDKFIQHVLNIRSKSFIVSDSSYLTLSIGADNKTIVPGVYDNMFSDSLDKSSSFILYTEANKNYTSAGAPDCPTVISIKELNERRIKGTFYARLAKENSDTVIEVTGKFNVDNKKFKKSSPF